MDDIDRAQDLIEKQTESHLQKAKAQVAQMPEGKPGDCEICGEWSGRLVLGVCAPCRDKYNLP